jgi:excisionase family DNA binding protein
VSGPAQSPYLLVEEVAKRLRCSQRSVHELTRLGEIPHRKLPGSRRCLFLESELRQWENGAPLERIELPRGGRVVRPAESDRRGAHHPGGAGDSKRGVGD